MKTLKISAAVLLPLIAGIFIIIFAGQNITADTSIEPFFTIWLIVLPVCGGFVCGTQYPQKPVRSGLICGVLLALALIITLWLLLPGLRSPWFYLILSAIALALAVFSAFWGAAAKRARAILRQRRKEEPADTDDLQ